MLEAVEAYFKRPGETTGDSAIQLRAVNKY
jgi:hypothetical protein